MLTALAIGELAIEAGFPEGSINIVPGLGEKAGASLLLIQTLIIYHLLVLLKLEKLYNLKLQKFSSCYTGAWREISSDRIRGCKYR